MIADRLYNEGERAFLSVRSSPPLTAWSAAVFDDITVQRFWSKVDVRDTDECWPWVGTTSRDGYGYTHVKGKTTGAHRLSVVLSGREIQAGLVIDHVCRNRNCVNPAHLRVVTKRTNTLENSDALPAINARKTHCPRGHALSTDNLVAACAKRGQRECLKCSRDRATKRNALRAPA